MNKHPVLKNYKTRLFYASIWAVITAVQILVLFPTNVPSLSYAIADTFIFNTVFSVFTIALWYPVRFGRQKIFLLLFVAHIFFSCIVIAVWVGIGSALVYLLFSDNSAFMPFFRISIWWKVIGGFMFYAVAVLVYYLLIYIRQFKEKTASEIRLTQLIKDSELNMLKSQINPHFLFNGLNSVNCLILQNPAQAQKMLISLSDYLRYSVLSLKRTYSSLNDEIENIDRYLSIEKLRFGDKLTYTSDIDAECLPLQIPVMILQPLFENAVKHGVYESLQTVFINIKISKDSQQLTISIDNNFDSENISVKKRSGTGIKNLNERLRLLYGANALLQTQVENEKFTAILKIPVEKYEMQINSEQ